MQTKVQNMQYYTGYMKCGEILRPPFESYQRPYVLKCFHCKEIYLLFEAFIFHIEDHCKNAIAEIKAGSNAEEIETRSNNAAIHEIILSNSKHERMEVVDKTDVNIKEDPLVVVKRENIFEDEEIKPQDYKTTNTNDNDEENNSTTLDEVCETDDDSMENEGNNAEIEPHSSDYEIESNSDSSTTSDDDDLYEIRIVKQSNNDLGSINKQSVFIKEFLKTNLHVVALIEEYKNQPSLWNKNYPFLRHKIKRQNCLQKIADKLNEQHDLSITWSQVANIIVYLCRKYREDLKGIKEIKEGEKNYTPSWFFESLHFLKPFMENNPIAKLHSHLPDLLPNQIIEILEIYKGLPDLWNTQLIEHYCKNKIDAAKHEMLQVLETKMGLKITENILEDYFRTINNCFTRAKRNKLNGRPTKTNSDTKIEDNTQEDYYEYMLFLKDHVGSFKCSECQRSFKSPLYLKMHEIQVHGSEPLPCSLCQKPFKTVCAFTNHAKRHMKDLNHECKECGKKFLHSYELSIHMRNHTGAKPFCCEICGVSFRHIQSYNSHHRRHIKKYLHTCEICSKGFYSKDRYKDHMNAHSNTRNQVCNVCSKAFTTKRLLQQHVVIHDDVRRHACKLCGKTFKHKTGVNQHMRTHGITSSQEKNAATYKRYKSNKMQTKVQNMKNYAGYMKCGEILRPPFESYQRPYVLKCFHCKELYLLFEAFIFHIEDHCKSAIAEIGTGSNAEETETHSNTAEIVDIVQANSTYGRMEVGDKIDVNIKAEEKNFSMQMTDPLVVVKPENISEDDECAAVKEEIKSQDDNQENNSTTFDEICETDDDSIENADNSAEIELQSSDYDIGSSFDNSVTSDEDDLYEIRIVKQTQKDFRGINKQSVFIKEFLKTKAHVITLIEAYKNQPSLWNKNFPFLRHKIKRQNCLQKIADKLKEQHDLSITWSQVANVIVYLCQNYRGDLRCIKEIKEGEKNDTPSWFFESLNFLKPFMENNPIAKLDSHLPDLLPSQIIEILEIYKGLPNLWNTQLIEHYCKNKIHAAKQEMLQVLETKMGLKITENILEGYFRTINNCFTRAKRNKLDEKSTKKNSESNIDDNTQEDYYEYMIFLKDHVGSFKCSGCQRSSKSPLYLRMHEIQVHGSEPLPCSLCQKPFKTVCAFKNHAKRHMEDLNHECKECGKKFLHQTELRIHMRSHTGAKPFCCEICGASFRHIQSFSSHHRRHIKKYLHTCEICSKGFYSKDRYKDHMNAHSNTRNHVCNVCSKGFTTKRLLQQHVVIHDDVRRHACKLCGKTFKHKTGVNQHMRIHGITSSQEKSSTSKE